MSLVRKRISMAFRIDACMDGCIVCMDGRSHLKKQSRDSDVVGQAQNDTCEASEKMRHVNVKVHDIRCLLRKRE